MTPSKTLAWSASHFVRPFGAPPTYRGTSLIRYSAPLEPYSRTMPRALRWSLGGGVFLMNEVPLYFNVLGNRLVEPLEE